MALKRTEPPPQTMATMRIKSSEERPAVVPSLEPLPLPPKDYLAITTLVLLKVKELFTIN